MPTILKEVPFWQGESERGCEASLQECLQFLKGGLPIVTTIFLELLKAAGL